MTHSLPGVVLAAGGGMRLMPLTAQRPKPMLPIACRPLIEYSLEQLAAAGAAEAVLVISPRGEAIAEHLGDRWRNPPSRASKRRGKACLAPTVGRSGLRLRYIVQAEPRGTAHAVGLARDAVAGRPFLCVFGDNLTTWPLVHLVTAHGETGAAATVALFRAPDPRRHGVAEVNGRLIRRIVEKPDNPLSPLACAGMFLFEPEIFDAIAAISPAANGELQLTDAIQALIARGRPVAYAELDQWRININAPPELLEANRHMLERNGPRESHPQVEPPTAVLGQVRLSADARLGPYVSCGRGCTLDAGAAVTDSILLDGVRVGAGARVRRAVVGSGARIAPGAVVQDQVIGDNAVCG